jgi:hypothetical protein
MSMNNLQFPTGKFTYTSGEYSPVVDICPGDQMTISLNGEVIVVCKYQVTDDVIAVEDISGSHAGPEYGVGRYRWTCAGQCINFNLIEDNFPPRRKAFALPWCKVKKPFMPYYTEGNHD